MSVRQGLPLGAIAESIVAPTLFRPAFSHSFSQKETLAGSHSDRSLGEGYLPNLTSL